MRILWVFLLFLLPGCGSGTTSGAPSVGNSPERTPSYDEAGVTFAIPKEWSTREFPGWKNSIVAGPVRNEFAPNINVVTENFDGDLSAYADASEAMLEKIFEDYKKVSRTDFKSESGVKMIKLVITNKQHKKPLRQWFYTFNGSGSKKYVITCTALSDSGAELDSTFDETMKTLKLKTE